MIMDELIRTWYESKQSHQSFGVKTIFDVEYAHVKMENDDDFFMTREGLPLLEAHNPVDFRAESPWFKEHARRLAGTSCVYKVKTRAIDNQEHDLVIKWNRMGEEIPGAEIYEDLLHARFNSPFEEFALVQQLREAVSDSPYLIAIQKPLAIYVPAQRHKFWQTGRSEYKMKMLINQHVDVDLDMNRLYMMIYQWVDGMDAALAFERRLLSNDQARNLAADAAEKLNRLGFVVRDNKPNHVVIDPRGLNGGNRASCPADHYALIDFELLAHTEEKERILKKVKRKDYHRRQKNRFSIEVPATITNGLNHMRIFGVDYIFGEVESTKGRLWVVGKDPYLFDFFMPERWENTKRTKISMFSESYYTITKDNLHVVWEVSKVGLVPDMDPFLEDERKILDYGYNSPFEEVQLAVALSQKGVATIYPRAIYMMARKTDIIARFFDNQRYETHKTLTAPDGKPILLKDRHYVTIWGYWNGPDERLAETEDDFCEGINTLYAYREGIISREEYMDIIQLIKGKLQRVGVEDLNLSGKHLLISVNKERKIIRDSCGLPDIRICNFEFLKKMPQAGEIK